jgi:predicted  nucleic acid-binding Zn-ribbon protein
MPTRKHLRWWIPPLAALLLLQAGPGFAGVSRVIQERYRQKYENKALFLRIPIFSEREYVLITGRSFRAEKASATGAPRFKVADQVRVLSLDFGGSEIKFKLSAIGSPAATELTFKFDGELQEDFPNSDVFDSALQGVFTEGLKYTDIEEAKRAHAQEQFAQAVNDIAISSGASREAVLQFIAPDVPAYQDALRDIENLKKRNQDLASQIDRLQSESRELQNNLRTQQSEAARLRTLSSSLQSKIDAGTSELTRIRDDLGKAQGEKAGYQKELASLQRSLRLRTDAGRDLSSQISEIAQAAQRLQREKEGLQEQNGSLKSEVERQTSVNSKLSDEKADLQANVKKMRETISALTSKEDSLARQYINLKQTKDHLENIKLSVANLRTQVAEEKSEGGMREGKVEVYLANIHLGTIDWRLPAFVAPQSTRDAEIRFAAESIDYVRVGPSERHILQSLGERLRVQVSVAARSGTMEVKAGQTQPVQEVGERDTASWRWQVTNQGTEDARLVVSAGFVNKNSDEIPLWKYEHVALSSSIVRQVRSYLQPIPLAVGTLIGFLLFGVAGIFRRSGRRSEKSSTRPATYVGRKGL